MQGVNVFENGIGYLHKCLSLYMNGTGFFIMYVICIIYILIKGTKKEREIFLPGAVVLTLTVYNPLAPIVLDKIFDVSSEYYRLFWIAPVIVLVPYMITKLIFEPESTGRRILVAVFAVILFAAGGNYVYADGIGIAQNIYKIPDELMEISGIIHEDSGNEYTKAFFEYEYNMEIRQFDPKMLLCVDREDYLYAMNYSYTHEMLADESKPVNKILALLVRNQKIDMDDFTGALTETGTEYVVITKGHPQTGYLKKAGLRRIGETSTHLIYRYDLKEPPEYGLVDYSGAEHKFSYRRLK